MVLYHITSTCNLDSIKKHGLLSLKELEKKGLKYSSSSNNLSKNLDKGKNTQDYIKLTSNLDSKQIYILKKRIKDRAEDVFIIKIDDKVLEKKGTLYSNMNSTANKAKINSKSSTFYNSNSTEKEVLIKKKIEPSFLLNIDIRNDSNDITEDEYTDVASGLEASNSYIENEEPTHSRIYLNGLHSRIIHDQGHYEGEWKDSKRNGEGTQTWNNGNKYSGTWHDDKMNGDGTFSWLSGAKFIGSFLNDSFCDGKLKFASGGFYVGDFKSWNIAGKGRYTYSDGTRYEGGFLNREFHGSGGILYQGKDAFKVEYYQGELRLKQKITAITKAKKPVTKKKYLPKRKNSDSHIDRLIAQTNNKSTSGLSDIVIAIVLFYIIYTIIYKYVMNNYFSTYYSY